MPIKHRGGKNHKLIRSAKNARSGKYSKQRLKTEKNRKRRLTKRIKNHPNDKQAIVALQRML